MIAAVALRPFEGERRVFVIEAAEAMRDESQNALLKTLEEPPAYAHLILLSAEPEALLETIASRCQPIGFAALPAAAIAEELGGAADPERVEAAANLAAGDLERARYLLSEAGAEIRAEAESCAEAALAGTTGSAPWSALLASAEAAGEEAEAAARDALEAEKELGVRRSAKEAADEARRAGRRRRTEVLDLGLELCAIWLRDLVAVCAGAEEVVFNRDRLDRLRRSAEGLDPGPRAGGGRAGQREPPPARSERLRGASPRGALLPPRGAHLPRRLTLALAVGGRAAAPGGAPAPAPAPAPAW